MLFGQVKEALAQVTVEPITFCNFLAFSMYRVVEYAGIYEVLCVQNYGDDGVDCKNISSNHHLESQVQKDASTLNMFLSLTYLLPAIVSGLFLGAYADKYGRKVNILLGYTGLAISMFPMIILLTDKHMSLSILFVAGIIAGSTEYIAIVMIYAHAYISDIVTDKSMLTVRMAQVSAAMQVSQIIGSFAVGPLIAFTSPAYVVSICIGIILIGCVYTLVRIQQVPPLVMRKLVSEKVAMKNKSLNPRLPIVEKSSFKQTDLQPKKQVESNSTSETSCSKGMATFVTGMYKEVWHTFRQPRKGHRRAYLNLMVLVFLLFFISEMGLLHGPVLSLYTFKAPIRWTPAELGYLKGTQSALMLVGNLIGSWTLKKLFKLRDTTVMLICMSSVLSQLLVMAFSNTGWMLYLAVVLGMLGNLTIATMKSFVAQLVEPNEVGKAFTGQGVTSDIAFVLSALFFNNIYTATVDFNVGVVFFFAALLIAICMGFTIWIHIDKIKMDSHEINTSNEKKTSKKDVYSVHF